MKIRGFMKQLMSHVLSQMRISFRDPAYLFTSIALPTGLYWFFAVPESKTAYTAKYMTGSFSAFAFFGIIFLQYSIHTAQEKTSSWSLYLSTLPIRPWLLILSRLITSIFLGSLACGLIYGVSLWLTPTDLSFLTFLKMLFYLTLGSLPFLLMGLVVGRLFSPQGVVPVSNFFHLVLSFAGGLWKPVEILPPVIQDISPWLPTYHYGRLTWSLCSPENPITTHTITYLLVFALGMGVSLYVLRWQARS